MKESDWEEIKFFKSTESWGDPLKMDMHFMRLLDVVRSLCKHPFIIHCGWSGGTGHADKSYHYVGCAADFHMTGIDDFPALNLLEDVLHDMQIIDKVGYGFYPHWYPHGGFHLDCRGWQCADRPPQPGIHWVKLDKPCVGFKANYYYGKTADRIIKLLKGYK